VRVASATSGCAIPDEGLGSDPMANGEFSYRLRNAVAGGAAMGRAVVRRLRRGPTLPSWTWSEELFVAAFRGSSTAASRRMDLMGPGRMAAPIARRDRGGLETSMVDLAGIRAERYRPKEPPAGTILRFHGGGFVTGSAATERRVAAQLALATRCDTYGITYRLAPRHPYPAAVDDAVTAYRGLLETGADPSTTILFGGSAGAGLALATLLRCRAEELPMPAGAVLLWPYADFTFSGESIETYAEVDTLPMRDLADRWGPAYVGNADPTDPFVSPALADLRGLPPLLVIAGGAESLLSSAERIAANAQAAGVDVTLSVYPEKVHGWMILPRLPATLEATAELTAWIGVRLQSKST